MPEKQWMLEEIRRMKNDMNALILAHYYQTGDVQDLADVLGNFVNRIVKFTESKFDGVAPEGGEPGALEEKLAADVKAALASLTYEFETMEFRSRAIVERAALMLQGCVLLQSGQPDIAAAFCRSRLAGEHGLAFGTLHADAPVGLLIERAMAA